MAREISDIEKELRSLTRPEQEHLLQVLLDELQVHPDVDRAWLEEAKRRMAAFEAGVMESSPAEEVFDRVHARLKR